MHHPPHPPHPPPGPPYGHGYGAPPPYYAPNYAPRPPKKSNTLVIVLVILTVVLVLGGGGCLLCVGLAAFTHQASTNPSDQDGEVTSGPSTDGLARTPLASKLEEALKEKKIPVDAVRCPPEPPSQGSFNCTLATTQGDTADLVVTVGPTGLSYDTPDAVVLDGAKLEASFQRIVAQANPRLRAPCLTGMLMKRVGADFTCPVFDGATESGTLTVSVLDKNGEVKMTYEGSAAAGLPTATAAPKGGDTASVDGRYECFHMRLIAGPNFTFSTQFVPGAFPGFTISSGTYRTSTSSGTVDVASGVVAFSGGGYAGWRGTTATNSTGFYVLFRGDDQHLLRKPGEAKSGDYTCYRQKK